MSEAIRPAREKCDKCFYDSIPGAKTNIEHDLDCPKAAIPKPCAECGMLGLIRDMFARNRQNGMVCKSCHEKSEERVMKCTNDCDCDRCSKYDKMTFLENPIDALEQAIELRFKILVESRDWWRRQAIIWVVTAFALAIAGILKGFGL